jgi:hypothetical protein
MFSMFFLVLLFFSVILVRIALGKRERKLQGCGTDGLEEEFLKEFQFLRFEESFR